jgi:hypothetical protein
MKTNLVIPETPTKPEAQGTLAATACSTTIRGKLTMKDGRLPTVANMRVLFEKMVNDTECLKKNTPIGVMEINGKFDHYMHPDTDTLWIGFALGMRCAQRITDTLLSNEKS